VAPLPVLYPITCRELAGGRTHTRLVELLCQGGATLVQLRDKTMSDRDLLAAARDAADAARSRGARLVVNDRADIAAMAGADGVHVGGDDLPAADARALLGAEALVGCSTHGVDEAIAACALPVDYVALGPIFETGHASMRRRPLGIESVRRAAARMSLPLVVIGGFDTARAGEALEAGAASIAVMGDLMTAPDIPARVAAYLALRG